MSRTLSTNSGSLDSRKVLERWGLTLKSVSMRATVLLESPLAAAADRTVQWVAPTGLLSSTVRRRFAMRSSSWVLGRPDRASP